MTQKIRRLLGGTAGLALASGMLIAAPYQLQHRDGATTLVPAYAAAKDGERDDKSGKGRDRSDDRGRKSQKSEKSGKDDRGRDDRGDDSRRGGDDDRGYDDRGRDDDRDVSRRDDDDSSHVEVTLSDGTRVEIEDGRYERKSASGETIEERPATRADYARLQQVGTASGGSQRRMPNGAFRGGGRVAELEVLGENIEITYTDGWKEEIENGRYELKNELGETVIQRPVRPSDRARLFKAAR